VVQRAQNWHSQRLSDGGGCHVENHSSASGESLMLIRTLVAVLLILFVGLPGFVLVESFSSSFQSCMEQQTGREGLALIISYSRCSARFVNEHNGGLSALASLMVAAFTFTLWLIASSQFRHARDIDRAQLWPHARHAD
jgi:hypothetical protein